MTGELPVGLAPCLEPKDGKKGLPLEGANGAERGEPEGGKGWGKRSLKAGTCCFSLWKGSSAVTSKPVVIRRRSKAASNDSSVGMDSCMVRPLDIATDTNTVLLLLLLLLLSLLLPVLLMLLLLFLPLLLSLTPLVVDEMDGTAVEPRPAKFLTLFTPVTLPTSPVMIL